jgi:hypothetical protein
MAAAMDTARTMKPLDKRLVQTPTALAAGLFCLTGAIADVPVVPSLNSERIHAQFGSYGVEVLFQSARCRVSNLYSNDTPESAGITRTLAIVALPDKVAPELGAAHEEILAGASLGSTLRDHGWKVHKQPVWVGQLPGFAAAGWLGERMQLDNPAQLEAQAYQLSISRGNLAFSYVNILEIYHPAYVDYHLPQEDAAKSWQPASSWADMSLLQNLLRDWQPGANMPSVDPCDIGLPVATQLK